MNKIIILLFCFLASTAGCTSRNTYITIETDFVGEMGDFMVAGSGKAIIDWGDGSAPQTVKLGELPKPNFMQIITDVWRVPHTYTAPGTKIITVTGNVTGLRSGRTRAATVIDVSRMPGLKLLECGEERLTALDVSKNTVLTELDCRFNDLTALDISRNTALKTLFCGENRLSALDVSRNPALRWLYCNGNQLTADALSEIFAALPARIAKDDATIYCSGNPGYPELSGGDKTFVRTKNWKIL